MKNGPQNSIYYSVFQLKKNNPWTSVIWLQPFLRKVTNTANTRAAVAAINFFWFQSIQEIDYAISGSPLMLLLN